MMILPRRQFLKSAAALMVASPAIIRPSHAQLLSLKSGAVPAQSGDAPQMPNMFASYPIRPPAGTVPGVDFYVGCPSSVVLKPINTATLPAGVTVDNSIRYVQVFNANTVFDGYNFSVNGGYSVMFNANGGTIKNSKFAGQSTNGEGQVRFGQGSGSANNGTLFNCTFDATGVDQPLTGVISQDNRSSGMSVSFCWLLNGNSDGLATGGGAVFFQNNFIQNLGGGGPLGAHPDIIQLDPRSTFANTLDIQFNCAFSNLTNDVAHGIQGYMLDTQPGGAAVNGGTVNGNVIIGPADSFFVGNGGPPAILVTYSNNYFDVTNQGGPDVVGWATPGTAGPKLVYSNNWNLKTGVLEPTNP